MTRHQRRKAAKARALVAARREIVRNNLSNPVVRVDTSLLISPVYGNKMDRARGRGTTPIARRSGRVIGVTPGSCSWDRS